MQLTFTQSIADVFGEKPNAAMLFEGDFVASEINKLGQVEVGDGAKFFDWPSINGSKPAVVTAGDQAVAFKDTPEANALMAFLASPEAAQIMASRGGFLSANNNLDPSAYPDDTTRALAGVGGQRRAAPLRPVRPDAAGVRRRHRAPTCGCCCRTSSASRSPPPTWPQQLEDAAKRDFGSNG